ncbi:MAG: hypothetical protein IV100_10465 [Myxococcales bacterium]|nr:hypothetical protein [Myxococcales bacterium]
MNGAVITSAFAALVGTVAIHAGLGVGLTKLDSHLEPLKIIAPFRWEKPARLAMRGPHNGVAYERRRIDPECSLPECKTALDAVLVELKIAKLGSVEQDPKKLPVIEEYEKPEKVEQAVNVEVDPVVVKPRPLQDFLKKKAELDKRNKKKRKIDNLFNVDDDPRANPTEFSKITGRLDGSEFGHGSEQEKLDSYFGRASFELHKQFIVPTSISREEMKKQTVRVLITKISRSGEILGYRVQRAAPNRSFTLSAEAAIKAFVPSEGGRFRLPEPDDEVLDFVNSKGVLIDLDGRLFQ